MFSQLSEAPLDPLVGMAQLFAEDRSADKVDLGLGIYKNAEGVAAVPDCVKLAEKWLVENQRTKEYLSSAGDPVFAQRTAELILGVGTERFKRSETIQAPGGTGALRAAFDFVKKVQPDSRVFIPKPTWGNHHWLCAAAGLEAVSYNYYNVAAGALVFDEMMATISEMRRNDIFVVQACCHNPSGADLSREQVEEIIPLLLEKGAIPLIDLAYLGFAEGVEDDCAALRQIVDRTPAAMIATSYSKNFALYRERVGALTIVAESNDEAKKITGHLLPIVTATWFMPPDHGAAIVAHVLGDEKLRGLWLRELAEMRSSLNMMRAEFALRLSRYADDDFSRIAGQRGMFALIDITPEDVARLRKNYHVHLTGSGRINIAGLTPSNVDRVAASLAEVWRR